MCFCNLTPLIIMNKCNLIKKSKTLAGPLDAAWFPVQSNLPESIGLEEDKKHYLTDDVYNLFISGCFFRTKPEERLLHLWLMFC